MSMFLALFPIHAPAPDCRHHRAALNQLATLVPDTVTITGPWTGHTWTDPDGRHWWAMTAPAEGANPGEELATLQAAARHIDPVLAAFTRTTAPEIPAGTTSARKHPPARPRLEQLQELITAGESLEDAIQRCGWTRPCSASRAARRAGNLTLARTLETVSAA